MEQTPSNPTAKIVIALVIGFIVGFALGAFWQSRRAASYDSEGLAGKEEKNAAAVAVVAPVVPEKPQTAEIPKVKVGATPVLEKVVSPFLVFVENQSAGTIVEVTRVKGDSPVWVAVRELKGGVPGNILGARRVAAGENSAVSVELLRPTAQGGSYVVVLYSDNGDSAFNYREDTLISGVQGAFVAE